MAKRAVPPATGNPPDAGAIESRGIVRIESTLKSRVQAARGSWRLLGLAQGLIERTARTGTLFRLLLRLADGIFRNLHGRLNLLGMEPHFARAVQVLDPLVGQLLPRQAVGQVPG